MKLFVLNAFRMCKQERQNDADQATGNAAGARGSIPRGLCPWGAHNPAAGGWETFAQSVQNGWVDAAMAQICSLHCFSYAQR